MKFIKLMVTNFIVFSIVSLLLVNAYDSTEYCNPHIKSCCDLCSFSPKDAPSRVYQMNLLGTFSFANVYWDVRTDGGRWIVIQRNRLSSNLKIGKNMRMDLEIQMKTFGLDLNS